MDRRNGFAQRIKQYRKARGLTQAQLAERSGYGLSTIRKIESGVLRPSRHLVRDLATALELDPADLSTLFAVGHESVRAASGFQTDRMPSSPAAVPFHLPVPTTPLLGRAHDVDQVCTLLRKDVRLVTLLGTAGVGKTRVALAAAAQVGNVFTDGVSFISLAPVADPALIPGRIAQPLGVKETAGQTLVHTLIDFFRNRHVLLVLDNMEHLQAATPMLAELLTGAPHLTILVTSRVPLHIYGEHRYTLAPLAVPDTSEPITPETLSRFPGTALFVQRAQAMLPQFQVTPANASSIATICRRLSGLPLAIELAAARTPVLPPPALLARLDQPTPLLVSQVRDVPERLQSLEQALDWSYGLLDVAEQGLFRRLSVFVGGWTLSAAEAVCGSHGQFTRPVVDVLTTLLDHSLVLPPAPDDADPYFNMLEPISEYARARLIDEGEAERFQRRHASFFASLADAAREQLQRKEVNKFTWMDHDHDNLFAALTWARERGEPELALRIARALADIWFHRGPWSEGRDQLDVLLREVHLTAPPALRAALLLQLAKIQGKLGDYHAAHARATEALSIYQAVSNPQGCAQATTFLGSVALHLGDYATAQTRYEEALALYEVAGDKRGLARLRFNLWILAARQSDFTMGRAHLVESLRCFRELEDVEGLANALTNLGAVRAELESRYAEARALSEESVRLYRKLGDIWGLSYALNNLGEVLVAQHLPVLARACFEESLAIARRHKNAYGIGFAHLELGNLAWHEQDFAKACEAYEIALDSFRVDGNTWHIALALQCLARTTQSMEDDCQAAAYYADSLALHWELQIKHCLPMSLAGLAYLAARAGRMNRAAVLQGANDALIATIEFGMGLFYADRLLYESNVTATRNLVTSAEHRAWYAEGQCTRLEDVVVLAASQQ